MVTIEELRATVDVQINKTSALYKTVSSLNGFLKFVENLISEGNEFSNTIDIDALIAQQTPRFNELKAAVDTAYNDFQ